MTLVSRVAFMIYLTSTHLYLLSHPTNGRIRPHACFPTSENGRRAQRHWTKSGRLERTVRIPCTIRGRLSAARRSRHTAALRVGVLKPKSYLRTPKMRLVFNLRGSRGGLRLHGRRMRAFQARRCANGGGISGPGEVELSRTSVRCGKETT